MRQEHHKLVRDKIPDLIARSQNKYESEQMTETEYLQALREKLVEEAQEAANASQEEILSELADLYEVIDALAIAHNLSKEMLIAEQQKRRQERGGFEGRIRLLWTEKNYD
jgi:predicted house-cleaning noncanonical NTP pyrophosphatase (MazG superfamily)